MTYDKYIWLPANALYIIFEWLLTNFDKETVLWLAILSGNYGYDTEW
jgi:hypothetical protein